MSFTFDPSQLRMAPKKRPTVVADNDQGPLLSSPGMYLAGRPQMDASEPATPGGRSYPAFPKPLTVAPPPQFQQDRQQALTGGLIAALGAILAGRGNRAGGVAASFLRGQKAGADQNFARANQAWQQQAQLDQRLNQDEWRQYGADTRRIDVLNAQDEQRQNRADNDFRWASAEADRTIAARQRQENFDATMAYKNAQLGTRLNSLAPMISAARLKYFGQVLSNPLISVEEKERALDAGYAEALGGSSPGAPQGQPAAMQPPQGQPQSIPLPVDGLVPYLPGKAPSQTGGGVVGRSAPSATPRILSESPADKLKREKLEFDQRATRERLRQSAASQAKRVTLTREQRAAADARAQRTAAEAAARQKAAQQFQAEQNKKYRTPARPQSGELSVVQKAAALKQHSDLLKVKQEAIKKGDKKGVDNANAQLGVFYNIYPELKIGGSGFSKPRAITPLRPSTKPTPKPTPPPAKKGKTIRVGGSEYEVIR